MAAFQGRCNTKEPQQLSRPVRLLPAHSKDGPVALSPALSGGCMGVLKTCLVPSTTAVSNLLDDPISLRGLIWNLPGAWKGEAPKTSLAVASQQLRSSASVSWPHSKGAATQKSRSS
uniref:Uncharacterized protein n=1 Tax=Rhipicephalus zambeziensis TaxID=60191 RepID=A0A224YG59_9ACAR